MLLYKETTAEKLLNEIESQIEEFKEKIYVLEKAKEAILLIEKITKKEVENGEKT